MEPYVEESLLSALERRYGMEQIELKKMALGSAECFRVSTAKEKMFVKVYQKKHDRQQISKEILLCEYLQAKGMQVSEYVRNKQGELISSEDFGLFTVQRFIDGTTYEKFQVPAGVLLQSADLLAQIHQNLEDVSGLAEDFTPEWIARVPDPDENLKIEAIIRMAEKLPEHELKNRIIEECKWKIRSRAGLERLKDNFDGLTRKNSHGDYNTYQWICENEKIKAVIDFGSCGNLPVIWELIRSFTYADRRCKEGTDLDLDLYGKYLKTYRHGSDLNETDLRQGFSFYYYTLAMSTFGFKQYIEDAMQGRYNKLIEFALWRSRMSRWLSENAGRLDEQVYQM